MKPRIIWACILLFLGSRVPAQDGNSLLQTVKDKLNQVQDYQARGMLKTNVVFLKAPVADINIFYKRPDRMKIVNTSGISFIPKGSLNINLNKFLLEANAYQVLDAGRDTGTGFRILKLLPLSDKSDIVLSTFYIDEKTSLVRKVKNTTRDNGTYELELFYGKQAAFALPDKIIFTFNTKEYKLPKGVTFDYDTGFGKKSSGITKNKTGKVEIIYTAYRINQGVDDKIFEQAP